MADPIRQLPPPPAAGTEWSGWLGSSQGLALALALRERSARTMIVAPRDEDATRLQKETEFFTKLIGEPSSRSGLFPSRPSDTAPAHLSEPHIGWERLTVLHHLLESQGSYVLFTSLQALAQKTLPKDRMIRSTDLIMHGAEVDRDRLAQHLLEAGYERETLVEEIGAFAVRGAVIDYFPPHLDYPIRIELLGDTIESIRRFDAETQRSVGDLEEAVILPCREALLDDTAVNRGKRGLKDLADRLDIPRNKRQELEEAISDRRYSPMFDLLLPLFYEQEASLLNYLPHDTRWIVVDPFSLRREKEELLGLFARIDREIRDESLLVLSPEHLSLPLPAVEEKIFQSATHQISDIPMGKETSPSIQISLLEDLRRALLHKQREEPLRPLIQAISEWQGEGLRTLFVASSETTTARVLSLLQSHYPTARRMDEISASLLDESAGKIIVTRGDLSGGFRFDAAKLVVVTEHEIFGERKQRVTRALTRNEGLASLGELALGDAVVHIDFGVALYRGLERITAGGVANDFVHLEYEGKDKLYLPIYRLNKIQKYIGSDGGHVRLDRLGNRSTWEKTRAQAKRAVEEMAQELIALYATRKIATRSNYSRPDEGYLSFESEFPHEETRDQLKAIEEISIDLETDRPMDRLVCGDVGFGKTEVALRAAFRVAMEGKQVTVLVPTTILATQHFETFRERMKNYPIRVDFLSRFKTTAEQKATVQKVAAGEVDVLIGTHRILSKDISFRDLGLLIIDEEHRFGVKHKERIRQFRNKVDVITLTATPIPRTLQMSMAGIRDLSVINTPPLDRKSIETYLCRFDDALIRGAIRKELERGGQIFFVHNRVETIDAMGSYLKRILPDLRVEIAHGQMSENRLEATMLRFLHHEFDLLLCTTIIESGLDIPLANTILVNRADRFGLAQLYQLRGRVGRSDRAAYAYLLVPGEELIGRDALKRLKVLKRFTELGSGLKIALHDLEIRGAGNLLGPSQSGHIAAVGFELYTQLLEREVRRLKGEKVEEEIEPEILCSLPAYFPDDFVSAMSERLILYKRMSSVKTNEELEKLRAEILDRFGPLPPTAENLFRVIELKLLARATGVAALRLGSGTPSIEFTDRAVVHLDRLLAIVKIDRRLSLRPDNRLVIEIKDDSDVVEETKKILRGLS